MRSSNSSFSISKTQVSIRIETKLRPPRPPNKIKEVKQKLSVEQKIKLKND
jgi:hypothetical protein